MKAYFHFATAFCQFTWFILTLCTAPTLAYAREIVHVDRSPSPSERQIYLSLDDSFPKIPGESESQRGDRLRARANALYYSLDRYWMELEYVINHQAGPELLKRARGAATGDPYEREIELVHEVSLTCLQVDRGEIPVTGYLWKLVDIRNPAVLLYWGFVILCFVKLALLIQTRYEQQM